ncbi:MAG: Hsp20/alpha crystallin family protein [Coriobacteriales bacterium]|jgi:HSP20 family protein|nr:Hsp20/alpha crystallin family protein [Coriobacteriales bacterium]
MAGLVPFNLRNGNLARAGTGTGFEDFYNMLDDFFSDNLLSGRNLLRDTFKIDIEETDSEYRIEAELPGVKKEEIDLGIEDDNLSIIVNRAETSSEEGKNYIHRERRSSSMGRRVRLANAKLGDVKAKLEEGVLTITIPKDEKLASARKIDIE